MDAITLCKVPRPALEKTVSLADVDEARGHTGEVHVSRP